VFFGWFFGEKGKDGYRDKPSRNEFIFRLLIKRFKYGKSKQEYKEV
jgi:hypothetical protein